MLVFIQALDAQLPSVLLKPERTCTLPAVPNLYVFALPCNPSTTVLLALSNSQILYL